MSLPIWFHVLPSGCAAYLGLLPTKGVLHIGGVCFLLGGCACPSGQTKRLKTLPSRTFVGEQ